VKRILAIAGLTWKSAYRYRLFWILAALLAGAVVGLPLILKDDGTAKGLTQILLTYTLTAVATLLGIATLWLSCGTLARDVEECQIQMVTVKPIARWQIWLGKWLGILGLNAMLLALSGAAIFISLQWRASRLPADEQKVLRNEIFVARASLKERTPDYA
jgi:ABC-type transport system involved in multi-copper enzyme maturation permease subunit